jgi:hypothetical protein
MKLTLRELFLLVALAAMGCGWWVDRRQQQSQIESLRDLVDPLWKHRIVLSAGEHGAATCQPPK